VSYWLCRANIAQSAAAAACAALQECTLEAAMARSGAMAAALHSVAASLQTLEASARPLTE
jgi:hypothetical protein